jgi:hypothetical protein
MENIRRRDFIGKGGTLTLAAGAFSLAAGTMPAHTPLGNCFVHHVFFWLIEPNDKNQVARFETALRELVTIGDIRQYHLGKPAGTRREVIDSTYHYSLLILFEDDKGHDAYQVHPEHDKFRLVAGELCSKVLVYDSVNF